MTSSSISGGYGRSDDLLQTFPSADEVFVQLVSNVGFDSVDQGLEIRHGSKPIPVADHGRYQGSLLLKGLLVMKADVFTLDLVDRPLDEAGEINLGDCLNDAVVHALRPFESWKGRA